MGDDVPPNSQAFEALFSPIALGPVGAKNRLFFGPHGTGMTEAGNLGARQIAYYEARIRNDIGALFTEAHNVESIEGQTYPNGSVASDHCIPPLRQLAELCQVHDCRLFVQLYHEGRARAHSRDGSKELAYAPSALPDERFHTMPRELTVAGIHELRDAFVAGAQRVVRAGADGIEILVGMGYLYAQFLSEKTNVRTDEYGGTPQNRRRALAEVLSAIRDAVGPAVAVGFRIVLDEREPDGQTPDESIGHCVALATAGLTDFIHVALGGTHAMAGASLMVPPMDVSSQVVTDLSHRLRSALAAARSTVPVIVCGRLNQPQDAERALTDGAADAVAVVRALIADDEFVRKAKEGRSDEIRACIACNQACIGHRPGGFAVSCIQHPVSGRELEFASVPPPSRLKRVLVIGGGPAGMKAAVTAAARGHEVTLVEKDKQLGGQVRLAEALPHRSEFGGAATNLENELARFSVSVETGRALDVDAVVARSPDTVIVATGASPAPIDDAWFEGAPVVSAWDVIAGTAAIGRRVVVADWACDWIGPGVAELIRDRYRSEVTLAVNGETPGQSLQSYVRHRQAGRLHAAGVVVAPYLRLIGADADSVYCQHVMSEEPVIFEPIDTLVVAYGHRSDDSLLHKLQATGLDVRGVGDCLSPRTVEEAVLEGLRVGSSL